MQHAIRTDLGQDLRVGPALVVRAEDPEDGLRRNRVREEDTVRSLEEPDPCSAQDLEVTLHHGIGPAPKAAGIAPLCGHRAHNEVVSEATARSASWEQTMGHNALHHVDVCRVVDVFAVRPLKVRNGGLSKRCGHI